MTKLEILSRLEEIRTSGDGVDYMRGVDNKVGLNKWSLGWDKLNSLSKDDIIYFLAEKSLTYTLADISRSIYHWYLTFKESSDFQTNIDADVIEAIAYSIWTYDDEREWGNGHYPFKK